MCWLSATNGVRKNDRVLSQNHELCSAIVVLMVREEKKSD
jgi:hypothetical protein